MRPCAISPHFGGGSGLKRLKLGDHFAAEDDLPSLRWGERIETRLSTRLRARAANLPSLRWGERIETFNIKSVTDDGVISPLTSVGGAD